MVFSSLLFLFLFFAVTMALYCLSDTLDKKNRVLLVASLIFYAWGGPRYLLLLLLMSGISWLSALLIYQNRGNAIMEKAWLTGGVGLQLLLLGYFKYAGFLLGNLQKITGFPEDIPNIVLPIGISFYTFQLISYVIDVYWGNVRPQRKYWLVLLYAGLFFQCIAGPIVRYKDIAYEIEHRKTKMSEIGKGINRFTIGLVKKAVFANSCAEIADTLLPQKLAELDAVPALGLWLGVLMYMLQIYLDFSAYSDMAIGLGPIFGFYYEENFNYPYLSSSITEFWRRWHISLSTWFRDYLYIPLGGNRKGLGRTCVNLFIVFLATGLWHGASMTFIIWGIYHGIFILSERLWLKKVLDRNPVKFLNHLYAMFVVVFGWLLFRAPSMTYAIDLAKAMIRPSKGLWNAGLFANNKILFLAVLGILLCGPVQALFPRFRNHIFDEENVSYGDIAVMIVLLFLSTMVVVSSTYTAFIYFQF